MSTVDFQARVMRSDGFGIAQATESNPFRRAMGAKKFRIGLLVPMCGAAGIWGPSCIASAQTALEQINATTGIDGLEAELVIVDAALEGDVGLDQTVDELIEFDDIDAIVGMHISAVRQQLGKVVAGRLPYIYTPLYEGGEASDGLFTIGETPEQQLAPAISRLSARCGLQRWALIGNDYVWPRASNRFARRCISSIGADVVYEQYVPFGNVQAERLMENLVASQADGVLLSLVGQDCVEFNRVFGELALHKSITRLSCAIEENGLLAIGESNTEGLYASSSYFSVLDTAANQNFKERYYGLHGSRAPVLNALGQSLYEGVSFLSALMARQPADRPDVRGQGGNRLNYSSARGSTYQSNAINDMPIYLARADGHTFSIVEEL